MKESNVNVLKGVAVLFAFIAVCLFVWIFCHTSFSDLQTSLAKPPTTRSLGDGRVYVGLMKTETVEEGDTNKEDISEGVETNGTVNVTEQALNRHGLTLSNSVSVSVER